MMNVVLTSLFISWRLSRKQSYINAGIKEDAGAADLWKKLGTQLIDKETSQEGNVRH